jgi:hypothetical protein
MSTPCIGGKRHGAVATPADDPGVFEPDVFADGIPEGPWVHAGMYGHCVDCRQRFLWSVAMQCWIDWPEPLHMLPMLSGDEVEELLSAVKLQMYSLGQNLAVLRSRSVDASEQSEAFRVVDAKLAILQSLDTALREARL